MDCGDKNCSFSYPWKSTCITFQGMCEDICHAWKCQNETLHGKICIHVFSHIDI